MSEASHLAGAQFHKCALQVNPYSYLRRYRGEQPGLDEAGYVHTLIAEAEALDVKVLAVTDHNDASGVDAIRAVAEPRGIVVFPGFELTTREGVHVLCLYAPTTSISELNRFLGEFGFRDPTPSSDPCEVSFSKVLALVKDQGGVTIAAHVTQDSGLLRVLGGKAAVKAWRDDDLLAVQIPGSIEDLSQKHKAIMHNRNADYRRRRPPESDLALAVLNAKDVSHPDDLEHPSATCLIKMSEVSIEGLRQAFLDPRSRIRLNSDPTPDAHSELVSVNWKGGFLDGTEVHFNTNLNVLVGGRGAGKSTVIESLRYALGLAPLGDEAHNAHTGIVKDVLRSGTKISLLVRSHRPGPREYRIERTVPNPSVVYDVQTGDVLDVRVADVFAGVEVYGQHEISELAKNSSKRTQLLGRFAIEDDTVANRKRELHKNLEISRRRIEEVRKELDQIDERLTALPGLEETLKRYQDAGLERDLREQSLVVREERILGTIPERMQPFRSALQELRQELPIDRVFLSPSVLEDLPGKEILAGADRILERLSSDVQKAAEALDRALVTADQGIEAVHDRFAVRKAHVQSGYEQKLRELQKAHIDGEEFIQLRRRIEALRPLKDRQSTLRRDEDEFRNHRLGLLAEWEDTKAEDFRSLERAAKKVSRQLQGRVRVRVEFGSNPDALFKLLREALGGRLSESFEALRQIDNLAPRAFAQACRSGVDALVDDFGIPSKQAERLAGTAEEILMRIEELDFPSETEIELNTAMAGEPDVWKPLDRLSTGQRATGILLLLLLESDAPLVVDQPEDDLDNRFITEGVVPRMRDQKRKRQFLFSTHNANIPVLGDAELIVGLSVSDGNANVDPEHRGSIDSDTVRKLVEELLEGGEDAFERRRRKYGF